MRVTGTGGLLLAGGRVAARLGFWRLERTDEAFHGGRLLLTARVLARDAFWSERGGCFDVLLDAGTCRWLYRGLAVSWGEEITAVTAGTPEVVCPVTGS